MNKQQIMPPRIVRDYLSNSLVWKEFLTQGGFVSGDIIVADPFKAGTTWVQRIVQQILDNGAEHRARLSDTSPWLDSSFGDHAQMLYLLQEQRKGGQRRIIKSHMPADALPIASEARYLFVGRNGKDLGISLHNYLQQFSPKTIAAINEIYAQWSRDPSPLSIPAVMPAFFDQWLDTDGYGCCDLFDIVRSWWKLRKEPNVLLVHYQQLKDDLGGQIVRIAQFLDVDPAILQMDAILAHCSFDYMRTRADQMAPFGGAHLIDPKTFFHQGPRRNYQTELTAERIARFDRMAEGKLESACVRWLEHGNAYVEVAP